MDVHRCRFIPYPTSPINTLAFNRPFVDPGQKSQKHTPVRLAVGRENGDIEIWNPLDGQWHQEAVMHGGLGRKTDALVWATEPDAALPDGTVAFGRSRLFSIGGGTAVTEWDLARARPKSNAAGQHGDIWCLGLQPPAAEGQASTRLVAGTGDGCLALYSIEDDDLRLQRILVKTPSKRVHFVSMAFQSRHVVAVGCSDASIRVFDIRNGSMIRRMTLGRDLAGGSKDIIVWCVKVLANGDIVSGDSTGQVCIWDGKTYTQAQRIQSHSQDVLSLAVNVEGSAIFSGGMDRKTILYKRVASQTSTRWSKVFHRRYHAHDVKALAAFEGKGMSVIVSGGSDASPVVVPLREAGLENHRTLSHLPQSVPLISASKARLIISHWGREINVWKVPGCESPEDLDLEGPKPPKTLKRILVKGSFDIESSSISEDGSLLAVSTAAELKLFQLSIQSLGFDREELAITRSNLQEAITNLGGSLVQVSPDGKWICLIHEESEILLLKATITKDTGNAQLDAPQRLRRLKRDIGYNSTHSGLGSYQRRITHVAFSSDSKMVATVDLSGFIDTWLLNEVKDGDDAAHGSAQNSEDSSDESSDEEEGPDVRSAGWIRNPKASLIPKLPAAATVLCFSSTTQGSAGGDYELLAVTTTSRPFVFHPTAGMLTPWSRRHPHHKLPGAFRASRDLIKGALWQGSRVWLYGTSSLFMFDTAKDLPVEDNTGVEGDQTNRGMKRKRDNNHSSGAGNRMEVGALDPTHVQKAVFGEGGERDEWVDLDMEDVDDASRQREDDDDESDGGELEHLRATAAGDGEGAANKGCTWWHTFKYRPILGAVPLAPPAGEQHLEVVLVERPLWDGLPARYVVEEERESRSYP